MKEDLEMTPSLFDQIQIKQIDGIKDITRQDNFQVQIATKIGSVSLSHVEINQIQLQQTGEIQSNTNEYESKGQINVPSGSLAISFKRIKRINFF